MYPRLSDLFLVLFDVEAPGPIYSFGVLMGIALVAGAWLSKRELDRMYAAGQLGAVRMTKLDSTGHESVVKASPGVLAWKMMLVAAVSGIGGAWLFDVVDDWERFRRDPFGEVLSGVGLTFYGGLVCAFFAVALYVRRKGLPVPRTADALAPGLLAGYGIGRIGCYLAGDGDWGVCSSLADKPRWIPTFLWSETFPRNILGVDVVASTAETMRQNGISAELCSKASGVFPTMLYETLMATALFVALWTVRRHPFRAGWLSFLYLVFNGSERFAIETIRLNRRVLVGLTQAQLIAIGLIALGAIGLARSLRRA